VETASNKIMRVIVTGPESTGKSTLAVQLAAKYHASYISEYARTYIENLNRPYNYDDVLSIGSKQVEMMNANSGNTHTLLFVDTYLIITKIWFVRVYERYPEWIDSEIKKTANDLYLLCYPDIPWIQDDVRENGGEMREILFHDYENELKKFNLNYSIVRGEKDDRFDNAYRAVKEFIKNNYDTKG
jgi:NadR type nicotinamide-nucleotide adenylyltransferase